MAPEPSIGALVVSIVIAIVSTIGIGSLFYLHLHLLLKQERELMRRNLHSSNTNKTFSTVNIYAYLIYFFSMLSNLYILISNNFTFFGISDKTDKNSISNIILHSKNNCQIILYNQCCCLFISILLIACLWTHRTNLTVFQNRPHVYCFFRKESCKKISWIIVLLIGIAGYFMLDIIYNDTILIHSNKNIFCSKYKNNYSNYYLNIIVIIFWIIINFGLIITHSWLVIRYVQQHTGNIYHTKSELRDHHQIVIILTRFFVTSTVIVINNLLSIILLYFTNEMQYFSLFLSIITFFNSLSVYCTFIIGVPVYNKSLIIVEYCLYKCVPCYRTYFLSSLQNHVAQIRARSRARRESLTTISLTPLGGTTRFFSYA